MAKLTLYDSADTYSDGDIENEILALAKSGFDITRDKDGRSFAVAYHFSPERGNILSWYPFAKDSSCLEIGAGCGAITGMLCEKCERVVSVDISKRRSEINYERNKDKDGLEIIAGNIQQLEINEKFDYVVLNGVFEYALSFIHTDTPYISMLELAKSFLRPDGKLFIAIENRLGLKYFNGAAEDHTDDYFLGLNGYAGNDSVRTFSKEELTELIHAAGFENCRFYYPYPDYKFPSEIFTDSTINGGSCGAPYMNLNKCSFGLYSESKVAASLAAEGIMDRFANSFLVEISSGPCDDTIDHVKINSLRREDYRIMTVLGGGLSAAYKLPLSEKARAHIDNMSKNEDIYPDGIKGLPSEKYGAGLKYPFIKSSSMTNAIKNEKAGVSAMLRLFFDKFSTEKVDFYSDGFKKVFGGREYKGELECIRPANIDLICDNIFLENDGYTVIDNEWVFDFYVPLKFIIWRCLNELYYKEPQLEETEPQKEAFSAFGIDDEMCEVFREWAVTFADEYAGNNYLSAYAQPLNELSLPELYGAKLAEHEFSTSCYYDRGNGFSEEDKVFYTVELDGNGNFRAEFPIPDDVKAFRWDPIEGSFIKCRPESVSCGRLVPDNAAKNEDGFDVFYTLDPHYTLTDYGSNVVICGKIVPFKQAEVIKAFEESAAAFSAKRSELEAAVAERDESIRIKDRAASLESKYVAQCENRIRDYFKKQVELNLAVERYQVELAASRAENERITHSRAWRFMSLLWRIKAKLLRR